MLEDLTIKNFALIDSVSLEFENGFTVLSGETGAGKSILIGALSFLLGGKTSSDQIRQGATEASVTATFLLPQKSQKDRDFLKTNDFSVAEIEPLSAWEWLSLHGIEIESPRIILRRVLKVGGKSASWIESTPVTRADIADFSSFLVDIHGQHEHQSLMRVAEHRKFLDSYAKITEQVSNFTKLYSQLVEKRRVLDSMNSSDEEKKRKREYLSFAVDEITKAALKDNEDVELAAEENRLLSFEKLYSEVEDINSLLSSGDFSSITMLVKRLRASSQKAAEMDGALLDLDKRIENIFYEVSDVAEEFRSYSASLVFDPNRLEIVQDRLATIYKLKKKYAPSVESSLKEVLDYKEQAEEELESLSFSEQNRETLEKEISVLEKKVYTEAKDISNKRFLAARPMSTQIENLLSLLGMKGAHFSVHIQEKPGSNVEQKCGPYGMDNIEFLISANQGASPLPLARIASGGELSRVMLALKTIFAESDTVDTLIFDEIDTGIGGEVAVAVGHHMKNLASRKQILCITHLASIAVYADNQIKIQKNTAEGNTKTQAFCVKGNERVQEIARMLSGDVTSEESLEHARSMLKKFSSGGILWQN